MYIVFNVIEQNESCNAYITTETLFQLWCQYIKKPTHTQILQRKFLCQTEIFLMKWQDQQFKHIN